MAVSDIPLTTNTDMITVIARAAIRIRAEQKHASNNPTANAMAIIPLLTDFLRINRTDLFRTYF